MKMVTTVVSGIYFRWMVGVAQYLIEIDHAIAFAAAQDPFIYLLTHDLFFRGIKSDWLCRWRKRQEAVLKRRVCRPNDLYALSMGTRDQLSITGDNHLGRYLLARRR